MRDGTVPSWSEPRHRWERRSRPPGRRQCGRCGACAQVFPSAQLAPEHRSDEPGTTLYRAPGRTPAGWRTRSGPCVAEEVADLPLLAAVALGPARDAWSRLELARWGTA